MPYAYLGQDLGECGGLVHDVTVWMEHVSPDDTVAGDDGGRLSWRPAEAGSDVRTSNDEAVLQVARFVRNSSCRAKTTH